MKKRTRARAFPLHVFKPIPGGVAGRSGRRPGTTQHQKQQEKEARTLNIEISRLFLDSSLLLPTHASKRALLSIPVLVYRGPSLSPSASLSLPADCFSRVVVFLRGCRGMIASLVCFFVLAFFSIRLPTNQTEPMYSTNPSPSHRKKKEIRE